MIEIQSLSLTVPTDKCVNNCKFCCSKLHNNNYSCESNLDYFSRIKKRLEFAKNKGCDTLILTSANGEALQNSAFLCQFNDINKSLKQPFLNIELQTTGVLLTNSNIELLKNIGVETISLSMSSFTNEENWNTNDIPYDLRITKEDLCCCIQYHGFNLRLSLNMTKYFEIFTPEEIFEEANKLNANQITFRKLYSIGKNKIADWIDNNKCSENFINCINNFIKFKGLPLEKLSFGGRKYSVNEISAVIDDDCMSTNVDTNLKYMIIREDGRLYTRWEDKGSLLF